MRSDTNWAVIDELSRRIDAIGRAGAPLRACELATGLNEIRVLAGSNGLTATLPLIRALESALARGERGPIIASGLSLLRDAVQSGDPHHGTVFAAAHAVRFGAS